MWELHGTASDSRGSLRHFRRAWDTRGATLKMYQRDSERPYWSVYLETRFGTVDLGTVRGQENLAKRRATVAAQRFVSRLVP